jgi:hypothetical protein
MLLTVLVNFTQVRSFSHLLVWSHSGLPAWVPPVGNLNMKMVNVWQLGPDTKIDWLTDHWSQYILKLETWLSSPLWRQVRVVRGGVKGTECPRVQLGYRVPGGYKYGDLAFQVRGVSDETSIYGYGSCKILTSEWLHCKLQTHPLVREEKKSNCQTKKIEIW